MSHGSLSISRLIGNLILLISAFSIQAFAQINNPHGSWSAPSSKSSPVHAQGPICTNGQVYDFANGTHSVYLGGSFTVAGRCSGSGVPVTKSQGRLTVPIESLSQVNGTVKASIPDGIGGWYIAGEFISVGGVARNAVAHINSDSTLDVTFNPNINGAVNALYLDGTTLYIGGSFTTINGDLRQYLGSISAATGATLAWNPQVDSSVNAIDSDGASIFAGGEFKSVAAASGYGGEVDFVNGTTTLNFPFVNGGEIREVLHDGSGGYYIAGVFTHVAGLVRTGIAHINSDGSVDTNFVSTIEGGNVARMMIFNGELYLVGDFTKVNSTNRIGIASVNPTTGALNSFNPMIDGALGWGLNLGAITNDGTNIFFGGHFSRVGGTEVIGFAGIDRTTAATVTGFPEVEGIVKEIISDGSGGWFIGGNFSSVGGVTRNNVAKINADKTLDTTWNANVNGVVEALVLNGSDLFIGGQFASVGGQARLSLASVSATGTGAVNSFTADIHNNMWVLDLLIHGGNLYVAGNFTRIGNGYRNGLASLDPATGALNAFTTAAIPTWGEYKTIAISGSNIYVGGNFDLIGSTARYYLAAFDFTTGALQGWAPPVDNTVDKIAISGSTLYLIGAQFNQVNTNARRGIAAVSLTTGTTLAWDPSPSFPGRPSNPMNSLIINGTSIYVGGLFSTISATSRSNIAEFDLSTGNLLSWNPQPGGEITAMYVDATNVYVAGTFKTFGGTTRLGLASVNTSGVLQAWNPGGNTDSILGNGSYMDMAYYGGKIFVAGFQIEKVGNQNRTALAEINSTTGAIGTNFNFPAFNHLYRLLVSGTKLYMAGAFANVLGQARTNLAEYDLVGSSLTSFNPDLDGQVNGIDVNGSTIYVAGIFTNAGGQYQPSYAAFDLSNSNLTAWNPHATIGGGNDLAVSPDGVYIGGAQFTYGGTPLDHIGKFSKITAAADMAWTPNPNGIVHAILQFGSLTYFGGEFLDVNNGTTRNYLAQVDATGTATAWNPSPDSYVKALFKSGSIVYVGGGFAMLGPDARAYIGAVAYNGTGAATSWDPQANSDVYSITSDGTTVFIGGNFLEVGGNWSPNAAAINASDGDLIRGFINFGGPANTVSISGSNVYFGGSLILMHGQKRTNLAAIDRQGNLTSWDPSTDGNVSTLAVYGSTVYVGGTFTFVNGVLPRTNLAAFNADTGAAIGFIPNPDGNTIFRIYPTATAVFVIGDFSQIGGISRDFIASLNPTTGAGNAAFNAGPNQLVLTAALNGSTLYVGGNFTTIGGQSRSLVAELNATTGAATSFNPGAAGYSVFAIALSGSNLYVGGNFYELSGNIRDNIGAVDTTSGLVTTWAPEGPNDPYGMGMSVTDIKITGNTAVVVGYYNRIGGVTRNGLAMIDLTTGTVNAANPVIDQTAAGVCAIEGNNVYFSGWLSSVNGKLRTGFAVINITTGNLTY